MGHTPQRHSCLVTAAAQIRCGICFEWQPFFTADPRNKLAVGVIASTNLPEHVMIKTDIENAET